MSWTRPPIRDEPSRPWVELVRGIRVRRLVEANGATLALYRMQPGTTFPPHSHAVAELGVVLSGSGQARFADEVRDLRAGDSFYVPPGTPHNFRTNEGEPVVMLNVTVPLHETMQKEPEAFEEVVARVFKG